MARSLSDRILGPLSRSRDEADRIIADARERARALNAGEAGVERALAETQLARLAELRSELDRNRRRIDAGYARLAETMATASSRLAQTARDADFSPPPWPGGIGRTVEIKLAETREVTLRFTRGAPASDERREGI